MNQLLIDDIDVSFQRPREREKEHNDTGRSKRVIDDGGDDDDNEQSNYRAHDFVQAAFDRR